MQAEFYIIYSLWGAIFVLLLWLTETRARARCDLAALIIKFEDCNHKWKTERMCQGYPVSNEYDQAIRAAKSRAGMIL